ncbi:MAG: BACON domain-containing protein [Candidatus Hydrogenedentes bacterium]|nr:BACON domain-containing protein [Candidatus Hydrogenedentota bacterium]
MRMLIRRLAPLGLAAMLVVLAGCPLQPSLSVTPLALDFSAGEDLRTFRIRNQGAGTLEWQAQSNASWLLLAESTRTKQSASVSGTTTTEIDVVEVTVDRSQLALGQSNGLITITSNDGTETIPVSVTQTAPAQLEVSSTEVNLGISGDQATFTITNTGNEDLEWSLSETAPWLTVSPTQGTAEQGESNEVTVRVERAELPGGESTANIAITSNGGNANVLVRVTVPPFAVSPESVEFGFLTEEDAQVLALTNNQTRSAAISITTTTSDGAAWLTVDQPNVNVPQLDSVEITVQVDPAGLPPGEYNGQVRFNDAVAGFSQTVPVSMAISAFVVSETLLEFGEISTTTTRTFSVSNIGTGSIAYSISVPAADAEWLSVNPASGNVTGDDIIEVRIDPAAVAPGSYESTLTITFEGGETTVAVRFSRPRPATLRVEPNTIDFSTTRVQELIGIWNDGIGTINWEVDTTAFPAWLVLTPVDGSGIASGTVSGAETDTITVRVRRELAPPGEFDLEHQFLVEASGDSTTPVQVTIRATVPLIPAIEVIGDGADENLVQFVNFDVDEIEKTFVIRNTGTGDLNWSIDLEGAPAFISSVSPQQGVLGPGAQQTVTITVDRSTLDFLGAQFTLQITSNDPVRTAVPLLVEVQVAKKIVIGARPLSIPFGVNVTSATLEVANFGDPETVLNFKGSPPPKTGWPSFRKRAGASERKRPSRISNR